MVNQMTGSGTDRSHFSAGTAPRACMQEGGSTTPLQVVDGRGRTNSGGEDGGNDV